MRRTILVLAVLSSLTLAPFAAAESVAEVKPNIIFITSDDHRWDALGAAGNPAIHTPVLDRLAAQGRYFRQATTHVAQCLPARTTLVTGLTAHQHGAYSHQNQRPDAKKPDALQNLPTVPGLLRGAGYRTVLIGKWHLEADPWLSGFSDVRTWLLGGGGEYHDPDLAHGNSRKLSKVMGNTQQIFADDAVGFLRSPAAREKPFLLWLAFTAPHVPMEPNSPESQKLYAGKSDADLLPPGFPKNVPVNEWRHYYEAVSDLDRQVGRIVAALEENDQLAHHTILVFLGDNGFMMGQRGVGNKDQPGKVVPYEGSIRVPLIVWSPYWKELAGTTDVPASSLDVPVTLIQMARIQPPASWPGRDLLGKLHNPARPDPEDAFTEWADEDNQRFGAYRLVRTPRHKLIVWKDPKKPAELYDLTADPAEEVNLYERPEAREVRGDLEARLRAWMEKTQDPARQWRERMT